MKKITSLLLALGMIFFSFSNLYSQCTNTVAYASATAPSDATVVQISSCNEQDEYSTVDGFVAGSTYEADNSLGGYITVHSGTFDGPVVASGNAPLSFTATVSGTYFIHYNTNSGCGTAGSCCVTTITCTSAAGGGPCASATTMACGTTYSGTLAITGSDWDSYTDCTYSEPGDEAVFTITPTTTGVHTITTNTTSGDADFFLMSSCGNTGTNIIGACWSIGNQTPTLTAGTTYYLIIDNYSSSSTASYEVSVTCPVSGPCASATAMACGTTYSGTLATTGSDWDSYTDCTYSEPGDEAVFTITPTSTGVHTITTNTTSGDADFFLMSSCGNTGTNIIGSCWSIGDQTPTLTAGITYYLIVDNYSSSSTASYEVSVTCPAIGPCSSATAMVCGTTYSGNLLAQVGDWDSYTDCTWGAGHEVIYTFTAAETGVHTLTGNTVSGDPDFFLMSSCGNTGTNIIGSCWGSGQQTPTLTAGTTYYLIIDNYSATATADYEVMITCPNATTTDCPTSSPFCTDNSYTFPAAVDEPDMGSIGCLFSTPNPAWYFMEIDNPGDIIIDISSGGDVDFIAWGPYPDLNTACTTVPIEDCATCPNNTTDPTFYPFGEIIDCSYDSAADETANIYGASSGDVYVLLITNYANVSTNISFVQSGGSGSTNCGIIAPPVSNNGPLCVGQTLELYVSNPTAGATYAWTGPDGWTSSTMEPTRNNVTLAMAGTYSLVITVAGVDSDPVTTDVEIYSYPTAGITNNTGTTELTCIVNPISVTATGGGTYAWSGGSSTSTAGNTFSAAGTYTVTVTNNVCTDTEDITITQNITAPTAAITNNTGSTIINCTTLAIDATATGGGTYAWSGGTTPATANNIFNSAGTYTVTVTAANGCTDTENITVTVDNTPPTAGITNNTGSTIINCTILVIDATATGGGTYAWSGGTTPATANNIFNSAGTYTVTVTAANGCTDTENITVTVDNTPPTAGITNNTGTTALDCITTVIDVTASGGGTYAWSGGSSPATANNTFNSAGTYTVTVTAANGCTDTENITITQNATPPTAGITNNTGSTIINCTILAIDATATGGGTYAWSGGSSPATANNTFNSAGTYTVTVTAANGCTDTENITITVDNTPPTAGITNNTGTTALDCTTLQIDVTATGGGTYAWSGGSSPATANNIFNSAGTYTVTVTAANGCTDTENITITQNATPPTAGITNNTGSTVINCTTLAIDVTATGGATYAWDGGTTPATANNTFNSAGTYTVTVTAANGCTDTDNITITVDNTPPTPGITNNTGTTVIDCSTLLIDVTATGGGTYAWDGGSTPAIANNTFNSAGTYTVTVTAPNGCTATDNITVTVDNTPPTPGITNNTGTTVIDCITTIIDVTATGGGTYAWSGGTTPAIANNTFNSAGTYTVTVTAPNGCTASDAITITESIVPPTAGITNNTGSTLINCSTLAIDVTATGGGTYAWDGGATPATANNIFNTAGTYTVTVTAPNGCTATDNITITVDNTPPTPGITNNTGTTIIDCTILAIDVTATGGGTYAWDGGTSPATANNIFNSAGTYTVTITAANGCTATDNITITVDNTPPTTGITNNTGTTIITCTTTSIDVTATGGVGYAWDGGTTPATANNILTSAGTYTVTVTAANGCTATDNITLTEALTITASVTAQTEQNCSTPGSATVQGASGIAPYTYTWPGTAGGVVGGTASALIAGSYNVTVEDVNGCSIVQSVNISDIGGLVVNSSVASDPLCFGNTNGSIDVTIAGGTANYYIDWGTGNTNTALTNYTINTLSDGTYNITVTDANGCQDITSSTLNEPTQLVASSSATAILCNGGNSSVTVSAVGGTSPYGGTGIFVETVGTYNYTVTDANGCTDITNIVISEPNALVASSSSTAILCNGGNSTVTVTATDGTPPYIGTGTFTETAGTYNYTVTDANACSDITNIVITEPSILTASIASLTDQNCTTLGSASVDGANGTGPYTYFWPATAGGVSGNTASALSAGSYDVTVQDANGCQVIQNIGIVDIGSLTATSSIDINPLCNGNTNGSIDITILGGTPNFIIDWGLGSTSTALSNYTIPNLGDGTYNITITDVNGCYDISSTTLTEPSTLVASSSSTAILCNGGNSNITVSAVGGTAPYSGIGAFAETAGTYNYTVTDANGCTDITNIVISEPNALVASSSATTIMCNGGSSTVTVSAVEGTTPYTGTGIFSVTDGTYNYTVTDANGCTDLTSIIISEPSILTASVTAISNQNCSTLGSATVNGANGTGPYTYFWPATANGVSGNTASALSAGSYDVTVEDANSCQVIQNVNIIDIGGLIATSSIDSNPLCNGNTNGSIDITIVGGTPNFIVDWGTGNTSTALSSYTIPNLGDGTYNITITDINGCSGNTSTTLSEPTSLIASSSASTILCNGGNSNVTVSAAGGTAPYGGTGVFVETAGTYNYTVTDANGCIDNTSVIISEPNILVANSTATAILCNGGTSTITVGAIDGTTPYTGTGTFTETAGTYNYTVVDANGCSDITTVTIGEPSVLTSSITTLTNQICSTPGAATVQGANGTGSYSYFWPASASGISNNTASALTVGSYDVTVEDANGCQVIQNINITDIGTISATSNINANPLCNGDSNGSIDVSIVDGTANFTINWGSGSTNTSSTNYTIPNLGNGVYNIVVTDANGCTDNTSTTLTEPVTLTASSSASEILCYGGNSTVTVSAANGITPYTGTGTFVETAGTYNYTITDANGCIANTNILINEPGELIASSTASEILCNGETSNIIITATQGTTPYTGTGTFTETAGTYTYTVLDANGCSDITTIDITEPETLIVTDNATNALCNGFPGSSTVIVISGGTDPIGIIWDDFTNSFTNNNVPANTVFGYTVTDANSCEVSNTVFVTEPQELIVNLNSTDVSCFGGCDGTANIDNIQGGTVPYEIIWSTSESSNTIGNLCTGMYQITITDANGCEAYSYVNIGQPVQLQIFLSSTPAICGSTGGSAFASVVGGTMPNTINWSNTDSGASIENLDPGTYFATVIDANLCTASESIDVGITGNITAEITTIQSISCFGDSDGILEGSSPDCIFPISCSWSNGYSSAIISNLSANTYIFTITDGWGCVGNTTSYLNNPTSIDLSGTVTNVSCFGYTDGSILITMSSGTPPYDPQWDNSNAGNLISDLSTGSYIVTVTDANNCSLSQTFEVSQPDRLLIEYQMQNVSCFGNQDGAILFGATGGTTPYSYYIYDGINTGDGQSHNALSSGDYSISVIDNNGCASEDNIIILEPSEIIASLQAYNPSCIGNRDGYIELAVIGGTEPYLYSFNNSYIDIPIITSLISGEYEIIVADSNNCTVNLGTVILEDEPIDCIKIPNAFTPNEDGVNDTWIIENLDLFPGAYTYVYNRWGQELYMAKPTEEHWDGKFNSKYVPSGTYLYIINLYDGTKPYTGTVSIIH